MGPESAKKKKDKKAEPVADGGLGAQQASTDFLIKPQAAVPALDTSKWPLLLKNYDKLCVRTGERVPPCSAPHSGGAARCGHARGAGSGLGGLGTYVSRLKAEGFRPRA